MVEIFQKLSSLHFVNYVGVDDFSDKLSFLLTPAILTACSSLVAVRTYIMYPLACVMPTHLSTSIGLDSYVNNYCWTEGTYAIPVSDFAINSSASDGGMGRYKNKKIGYYQWIPFMLMLQACMCYIPRVLWHLVSFDKAGTDLGRIMKTADSAATAEGETHDKLIIHVCRMIWNILQRPRKKHVSGKLKEEMQKNNRGSLRALFYRLRKIALALLPGKLFSSQLMIFYFIVKVLYLTNAVAQLKLMQQFLNYEGNEDTSFGFKLVDEMIKGKDWHSTMYFPRVGCCAIFFRNAADGNWLMAQCTLPVNMINEKVFIFLWFWFMFLAALTIISVTNWLRRLSHKLLLTRFVQNYLKLADNYEELKQRPELIQDFVNGFIGRDGAFLLRMISLNCGDVICSEIVHELWDHFKHLRIKQGTKLKRNCGIIDFKCSDIPENWITSAALNSKINSKTETENEISELEIAACASQMQSAGQDSKT